MMIFLYTFILTLTSIQHCIGYHPLLQEITTLYPPNAFLDDLNSIAIDTANNNIYATNTASGTIDIISYSDCLSNPDSYDDPTHIPSLTITRSIDIELQSSPYFKLDYITSITYSSKGYMIATLIPLNYAKLTGWLVFINTEEKYIENFIQLKYCYSPKHIETTSDGNKLIIACEGLADGDIADPAGSISVVDITDDDPTKWRIYNVGFTNYDECDEDAMYDDGITLKHLPQGIYLPKPEELFSINAEPEYITIDTDDRYAYITLQENNGVAILDIVKLEIVEIFSFGAHDFGFSGLDASDKDNGIFIKRYPNVFGLRQPDGISYYESDNGKKYILTANEGNAKYYDTLRVNKIKLNTNSFPDALDLEKDSNLGRLQILNDANGAYGKDENGEFEQLYAFGSRDFAIWQIEGPITEECPCDYPYGLRMAFSSYDDFEQITAAELGLDGFNSDFYSPSFDTRSDGKGPEPESITVGQCANGDVYAFIGLERVGGVMVYDITDIDDGKVYYVEYLNTRDFTVQYDDDERPPESAGDVEPETMIFIPDTDDTEVALLFVSYKTSASLGVYSFDCGCHRNYKKDNKPEPIDPIIKGTADECIDQSPCINVDVRPITFGESINDGIVLDDDEGKEMYVVCMSFDTLNPYCTKDDEYFTYGVGLEATSQDIDDETSLHRWYQGIQICRIAECNDFVRFAIKDGEGCANSDALSTTIDNVDFITCQKTNGGSCRWEIPTPICTTTTSETGSDSTVTTSTARPVGWFNNDDVWVPDDDNYNNNNNNNNNGGASTCDEQGVCLDIITTPFTGNGGDEYEICIYWNGNKDGCMKQQESPFNKVVVGDTVQNDWESGMNNKLCQVVGCGQMASFGIKDEDCDSSVDFEGMIDNVDGVQCSGSNGGYGVIGSCKWSIPAPQCEYTVIDNIGDDNTNNVVIGEEGENTPEKKTRNTFDTITNKGGHFYESTMFYILLAIVIITFIGIIVCVYKHSKSKQDETNMDDVEQEFSEFAE